ncbi:MAG: uroporphyrinogen-III synthase [Acidimicrobiales bacterium]
MLSGRRIVITRSATDNRSLAASLAALGAAVIEAPLVEVLPPADNGAALLRAAERLSSYRWVVLTSANAVDALAAALAEVSPEQTWPEHVMVAPVGPTTEAAAKACGFVVADAPAIATAEALVAAFPTPDGLNGDRVLAPLAELASDTVATGLSSMGYSVDRVTAYRTAAPAAGVADVPGNADAVMFFSPSVLDRFVARFGVASVPKVVICIGPSTAARAATHGLSGIVTASPHTEAGVVAAAREVLGAGR